MPPLSFLFRCVAHSLSLSSCLSCLALLVRLSSLRSRFGRMFFCPTRIIYGCHLCVFLFLFVFTVVSWFSLLSPFLAMTSFAGYFHLQLLMSAFLVSVVKCFSPAVFVSGLFWFGPVYLVTTVGFVADQLTM